MVSPLINYSSKAYGELCFWAGCILYYWTFGRVLLSWDEGVKPEEGYEADSISHLFKDWGWFYLGSYKDV